MMKRNLICFACFLLMLLSCIHGVYSQRPNTYPAVPLIAIFRDAVDSDICEVNSDPLCDRIRSDDQGAYTNGSQGVAANFDQNGNLIINFQTGNTAERKVYFDFRSPFEPRNHTPPAPADQSKAYISTLPVSGSPYTPLQNMTLGSEQCLKLATTFNLGNLQWRTYFHRYMYSEDSTRTAYGVISCTAQETDIDGSNVRCSTWELEPRDAVCNTGLLTNVAEVIDVTVKGNSTSVNGLYYMPFKLTLMRKP